VKRAQTIEIDGSAGEGGGQILRTSLALSLVTGKPFRIVNIRAGRKKPGLLRQHLTAVQAAAQIGDAATSGAEISSGELVFRPEGVRPGEYRFAVGTAGSATLVFQTVLPALMLAGAPSRLRLEGGTHNPLAPPCDFLTRAFLPQLAAVGLRVEATLVRPGFNPAGGGKIDVEIAPAAELRPLTLLQRGEDRGRRVVAHLAALPPKIAESAFARFEKRMGWPRSVCEIVEHPAEYGPGFVLMADVCSEHITEVFTGFGEKGVTAERVADAVIDEVRHYLARSAPVGEYLADQLLLPMALGRGGAFRTVGLSPHTQTNIAVIEQFLPIKFETETLESGGVEVRLGTGA
jgi:RNA 3'-terminal phosphate cyclase (ATP)